MPEPLRVGVLASGRGSNFRALVMAAESGRIPAAVVVLVADRAGAPVLDIARAHRVEIVVVDPRQHPSREAHEKAVIGVLDERRVGLVCLAGYMRLLTAGFVAHFAGRLLNIHPSLLPAFPGLHPHRQALDHGVRVSGATVHFVDEGVDSGPVVLQAAVPVRPDDTEESLAARILVEEHRIYPMAIARVLGGDWTLEGRRFTSRHGAAATEPRE